MSVLQTRIDRHGAEFTANGPSTARWPMSCVYSPRGSVPAAPQRARAQHEGRDKLLVRDRIDRLLDPGSPFLEIGQLAGHDLYDDWIPSAGIVAGIGACVWTRMRHRRQRCDGQGRHVLPDHRAQAPARAGRRAREPAACIYLVDSGGAFLPRRTTSSRTASISVRIFYNQAQMSARGIPQLAVVMGSCTAGGAYVPAMCDESSSCVSRARSSCGGRPLVQAGDRLSASTPKTLGWRRRPRRGSPVR
jgi:3-methylcrotonyl-CoA carboxylase beta subunit